MGDVNSINKVILMGYICSEIKTGETKDNHKKYTKFQMATNEAFYERGTKGSKKRVEYHNIISWGSLAKIISDYGKKGMQVAVEGKLRSTRWVDRDGRNRHLMEVNVDQFIFVGKRQDYSENIKEKENNNDDPF